MIRYYSRWIFLLTLVYLALTSNLEPGNIVIGIILGALVTLLVQPREAEVSPQPGLAAVWAFIRYLFHLAHVLLISVIQVSIIVLKPSLPLRQGIVAIPADTNTDLGLALGVHAITLAPGELVVEVDDEPMMYTHCLDATNSEQYVKEAHDIRLELLRQIFK